MDEAHRPIAVQIDYADWLELEKLLDAPPEPGTDVSPVPRPAQDLNRFSGTMKLDEDPLRLQERLRDEWL